jgi:cytochrome c-type biogenesis protein CcmH
MRALLAAVLLMLLAVVPAHAVNPDEVLADPALEARARALSAELRCMVCQNQSIDDSNADLAKDLRLLVRERLKAGDTDQEVLDYLVSRYGEFVLLKPRLSAHTILLWGMPIFLLLVGGTILLFQLRKRPRATPVAALSEDEQQKLDALLKERR